MVFSLMTATLTLYLTALALHSITITSRSKHYRVAPPQVVPASIPPSPRLIVPHACISFIRRHFLQQSSVGAFIPSRLRLLMKYIILLLVIYSIGLYPQASVQYTLHFLLLLESGRRAK